jgi:hypothetical protein
MILRQSSELTPGEARTRQRQRRYVGYMAVAALLGGVTGFFTGFFDQGSGNLLAGDFNELKLAPGLAILLSGLLLAGFLVLPLWGFRLIDDYKREHSYIGYTGGFFAVMSGFPVWATLHAGGFVPPPHAFGVFAIGFVAMTLAYLYARWRL